MNFNIDFNSFAKNKTKKLEYHLDHSLIFGNGTNLLKYSDFTLFCLNRIFVQLEIYGLLYNLGSWSWTTTRLIPSQTIVITKVTIRLFLSLCLPAVILSAVLLTKLKCFEWIIRLGEKNTNQLDQFACHCIDIPLKCKNCALQGFA
jgi:hypothetical protein